MGLTRDVFKAFRENFEACHKTGLILLAVGSFPGCGWLCAAPNVERKHFLTLTAVLIGAAVLYGIVLLRYAFPGWHGLKHHLRRS